MNRNPDQLPQLASISALVRRIVFRLNGELAIRGHAMLTDRERAVLFDLGEASKILDGVAVLAGMAQHEERARRDLLEIFDMFGKSFADPLETTQKIRAVTFKQSHELEILEGAQ